MENIIHFSEFLNEKKDQKGISIAIYNDLKKYFETNKAPKFDDASAYIAKVKKGWKLTQNDFDEAKKKFK
jgi:hypothetical protein